MRLVYFHLWSVGLYHIFSTLYHKARFSGKACEHKMCVLIFSMNLSKLFLILRRIQVDIFINVHMSS
jgi:hypothetical protein